MLGERAAGGIETRTTGRKTTQKAKKNHGHGNYRNKTAILQKAQQRLSGECLMNATTVVVVVVVIVRQSRAEVENGKRVTGSEIEKNSLMEKCLL